MAHTGGSLGGQCARLLCQGGVVKGELAGGLRVPGTAEVWGWKEEKQEDQDGPLAEHPVRGCSRRKDLRVLSHPSYLHVLLPLSLRSQTKEMPVGRNRMCHRVRTMPIMVMQRSLSGGCPTN